MSVTRLRCAKMAEGIKVLFGLETPEDLRQAYVVLDRGSDSPTVSDRGVGESLTVAK